MVFCKRNMFAFLKYIYIRPYMPQLLWEQGQISIDWELFQEKAVKFKEYIYIGFTSFILFKLFYQAKTCVYTFPPSLSGHKK